MSVSKMTATGFSRSHGVRPERRPADKITVNTTVWLYGNFITRLQIPFVQLINSVVDSPRSECHIGQRRILAGVRGHAGAISNKNVPGTPYLIMGIQHRSFRVAAHSCRPHLMDTL